MKNLENGTEFIWPKEKFLNRLYLMKEMYNNYEEEDDDWDLPEVKLFHLNFFFDISQPLHFLGNKTTCREKYLIRLCRKKIPSKKILTKKLPLELFKFFFNQLHTW